MGRGKYLTESEKGSIQSLHDVGFSNRMIARKINRSEKIIRTFLADPEGYGKHKSPGIL